MSAMTKKEWMEYLEKTWDAAQKEAWSEPQFECPRCGHCCPQQTKKQWVGLTDEDRNNLWRNIIGWGDPSHDDEDLMKAIEAKLQEKNT